jgi:hypothetical protein
MRMVQKIQVLIMLLTPKLRIQVSDVYARTVEVWVDSVHVRYITMTMLSVRLNLRYPLLLVNMNLMLILLGRWLLNKSLLVMTYLKMHVLGLQLVNSPILLPFGG